MIESALLEIGLTQNETKTYLALLDLGESKTGDILKKSSLNSGKMYEILDSLEKKGLISAVKKNGTLHFSPASPQRIKDYLEEKKSKIETQEKSLQDILPELLQRIHAIKPSSSIEIFTGIKGLRTAYSKELEFPKNTHLDIVGITSSKMYSKEVWDFFSITHQSRRDQKGYVVRKLLSENTRNEFAREKNTQMRYMPNGSLVSISTIHNLTTIGIYTENPIVISIEDQGVTDSFRLQFEIMWSAAKK
jgi:sugar-specific transcriptional regulator TrmB